MFKLLPADGLFQAMEIVYRENPQMKDKLLAIYDKIKDRGWEDKAVKGKTVRMVKLTEPEIQLMKELYESVI